MQNGPLSIVCEPTFSFVPYLSCNNLHPSHFVKCNNLPEVFYKNYFLALHFDDFCCKTKLIFQLRERPYPNIGSLSFIGSVLGKKNNIPFLDL